MKKQYIAPTLEVVDVEVHLMNNLSIQGETNNTPQWTDEYYNENTDEII